LKTYTRLEMETLIPKLEAELGELRRRRRAIIGGLASGDARQRHDRNERIRAYYRKVSRETGAYGKLVPTARKFGLSTRQVWRILRDISVRRDRAQSELGDNRPEEPGGGEPSRRASLAPQSSSGRFGATIPTKRASAREVREIKRLLRSADNLAKRMVTDADQARQSPNPYVAYADLLRVIGGISYDLQGRLKDLRAAIERRLMPPPVRRPKSAGGRKRKKKKRTRT
jgi:hypothetical protein